MEKDFENFFECYQKFICSSNDIIRPLRILLWKQKLKRIVKFICVFAAICCAIYYIELFNWYFCGVCRVIMIQILPIWNWIYLANTKCLISKATGSAKSGVSRVLNEKDCRACENFDKIDVLEKTTYDFIHTKFLVRGLPVIISDVALNPSKTETLAQFIDNVTVKMSEMVQEQGCSLETNLMISSFATVGETFGILNKMAKNSDEVTSWYLSFRNCRFNALKASRLIMSKPNFYPRNLQTPSSSWLLMSQNYENYKNELKLYGLIIVTQLRGAIKITLKAKELCLDICKDLTFNLFAGESLTFISELWTFYYEYLSVNDFTLTFITETDLN